MAPLPTSLDIPDLALSSLELDSRSSSPVSLAAYLAALPLSEREAITNPSPPVHNVYKRDASPVLSPAEVFQQLTARDAAKPVSTLNPGAGSIDPNDINMKAVQAAFALIGVCFVIGGIWFFFWAKNGGFQWRRGDWDDYKSTVMRRKGPNGTTLSNATKSTRLGGGSVVGQGYSDADGTMTELSSEAPIMKEKRTAKKAYNAKQAKGAAREEKIQAAEQATWEGGHDNDVRAYRHEKPARVGGLNKNSEAQYYGTDYSGTEPSVTNGNNRPAPQGARQPSRQSSPDKRASRRDFSYGQDTGFSAATQQAQRPTRYHSPSKNPATARATKTTMPGAFADPLDFDVQSQHTKTYHHHIPGLSGQGNGRGATGGYRRDRRDSLDD